MKMHKIRYAVLALAGLMVTACSDNTVFQESKDMPNAVWEKDSVANFVYNATDTTGTFDVVIDIRNQNNYPFQNFWLFANFYSPKGDVYRDTLECVLADNNGRWIGEGLGSTHHLPVSFLKNIKFPKAGKYRFELIQGMRVDSLPGISDIGVRINTIKK
ncbi:MAG: gliding motility lipoprotein GldH [Paludibacteraceae bacterium]|nr:gliding motility lipoprotein GldH [Paludibacteraceae bacterium]